MIKFLVIAGILSFFIGYIVGFSLKNNDKK